MKSFNINQSTLNETINNLLSYLFYLNAKERRQKDVGEYYQVNFVEEAAEHQDDEDQVHDGEHAQCHTLQ